MTAPPRRFYTVAEVADLLRMHKSTVYRRIEDDEIRAVRIGHRVVVPVEVIDELSRAVS